MYRSVAVDAQRRIDCCGPPMPVPMPLALVSAAAACRKPDRICVETSFRAPGEWFMNTVLQGRGGRHKQRE